MYYPKYKIKIKERNLSSLLSTYLITFFQYRNFKISINFLFVFVF